MCPCAAAMLWGRRSAGPCACDEARGTDARGANRAPQTRWLVNGPLLPHRSRGWKSRVKVQTDSVSGMDGGAFSLCPCVEGAQELPAGPF